MVPIRIGVVLLALATATIHVWLAFQFPSPDPLFLLNGLGYVGLLAALYLPLPFLEGFKGIIRLVFILFTALTIVLYFAINGFFFNPVGYTDKIIEVVLVSLLLIEARASGSASSGRATLR